MQTRRAIIVQNPCSYPIRLRRRLRCLRFGRSERKFRLRSPSVYLFMCLCRMRWVHSGSLSSLCALFSHDFARGTPPSSVYSPYRSVFYSFIRQTGYFFFSPLYFIRSSHSHPPPFHFQPLWMYTHISHTPCIPSLLHLTSPHPFLHSNTIVILLFEGREMSILPTLACSDLESGGEEAFPHYATSSVHFIIYTTVNTTIIYTRFYIATCFDFLQTSSGYTKNIHCFLLFFTRAIF